LVNPPLKPKDAPRLSVEDKRFFLVEHLLNVGLRNSSRKISFSALRKR
jgi:hypothetical protein